MAEQNELNTAGDGPAGTQKGFAPGSAGGQQQQQLQDRQQQRNIADETKHKAREITSEAQHAAAQKVESGLSRGKSRAAETLDDVAQTLRSSSQQLREREDEAVGRYVAQTADQVERLSRFLRETEVREMVRQTESFARRNPAAFLGGAFALGLLGARFLKSSERQEQATQLEQSHQYRGAGGQIGSARSYATDPTSGGNRPGFDRYPAEATGPVSSGRAD